MLGWDGGPGNPVELRSLAVVAVLLAAIVVVIRIGEARTARPSSSGRLP
jgi:hypothetical protein